MVRVQRLEQLLGLRPEQQTSMLALPRLPPLSFLPPSLDPSGPLDLRAPPGLPDPSGLQDLKALLVPQDQ